MGSYHIPGEPYTQEDRNRDAMMKRIYAEVANSGIDSWATDTFDDAPDIVRQVCKRLRIFGAEKFTNGTWNFRHVEDKSAIVIYNGRWYQLSDNGGEINVELINGWERCISVPSASAFEKLHPGTVASRVYDVLMGREIDYQWRWPESDEENWDKILADVIQGEF